MGDFNPIFGHYANTPVSDQNTGHRKMVLTEIRHILIMVRYENQKTTL